MCCVILWRTKTDAAATVFMYQLCAHGCVYKPSTPRNHFYPINRLNLSSGRVNKAQNMLFMWTAQYILRHNLCLQQTEPLSVTLTWHIAFSFFTFRLPLVKSQSFCNVWSTDMFLRLADKPFLSLLVLVFSIIFVPEPSRHRVRHLPVRHNIHASRHT